MRRSNIPAYRQREIHGQVYGMVRLTDSVTGRQQDIYLGDYGSKESRDQYMKELAAWEERGRRLPESKPKSHSPAAPGYAGELPEGITIVEMADQYQTWAKTYYSPSECMHFDLAIDVLIETFGRTAASTFGPMKLRKVRDAMIERGWCRMTINNQTHRIIRMFKWAAGQELVSAAVHVQLSAVEMLKRGRTTAPDLPPVKPVEDSCVDAIEPHVSRQIWALIQLQRLIGARGGELFTLRKRDIQQDKQSGIWTYRPLAHKTAYRGKKRTIYFGPKTQEVLRPFLLRPDDAYLFSPADAEREWREAKHQTRKTPDGQGNEPGTNLREDPRHRPGEHYDKNSYRIAIQRACKRAYPPPEPLRKMMVKRKNGKLKMETAKELEKRLTPEQKSERLEWEKAHRWHPHQLRHRAATNIRKEFGLEAASIILGHSSALVTDAVYAERDQEAVKKVILKIG